MRYRIDKVLAEGYTIGSVKILKEEENVDSDLSIDDEIIRFNNAIKLSLEQINKLKEKEDVGGKYEEVFGILFSRNDDGLSGCLR